MFTGGHWPRRASDQPPLPLSSCEHSIARAFAEVDRSCAHRVGLHGEESALHVGFIHHEHVIGRFERHPEHAAVHTQRGDGIGATAGADAVFSHLERSGERGVDLFGIGRPDGHAIADGIEDAQVDVRFIDVLAGGRNDEQEEEGKESHRKDRTGRMGGWEEYINLRASSPPVNHTCLSSCHLHEPRPSMITKDEKISHLETCLSEGGLSYADSFRADIAIFLGDFDTSNTKLHFLERLTSEEQISEWVNRLTSRIVMKFDEESEQLGEFIYDYVANG